MLQKSGWYTQEISNLSLLPFLVFHNVKRENVRLYYKITTKSYKLSYKYPIILS